MYLLGHEESVKAHEMFMGRLKRDERLMNIIKKNNVNIDDILYLPTDDGGTFKVVAIMESLANIYLATRITHYLTLSLM